MNLTKKELSDIIYEATNNWDYNPMSRNFSDALSESIIDAEKTKGGVQSK